MKTIYGIGRYDLTYKNCVLVIGVFDGVHTGHQYLLEAAKKQAAKTNARVVVMTFDPHPVRILKPEVNLPLIVSLPHRLHLLEQYGVDATLVVKFTKRFAAQSPLGFIRRYIINTIKPAHVFVGDDFRFGQNRSGGLDLFEEQGKRHGFELHSVKPKKGNVGKISSTDIRSMICEGNLAGAEKQLGHPVAIMGKVVKGDGRGKKLGFPTANTEVDEGMIPPNGVYATVTEINGQMYPSMTNIGHRPSVRSTSEKLSIETHIFKFSRDIYRQSLIIHFHKKIRDEKTFPSLDALVKQLKADARSAQKILKA